MFLRDATANRAKEQSAQAYRNAAAAAAVGTAGAVAVHDLDPHAAFVPELGLTMADGGEKVDEDEEKK